MEEIELLEMELTLLLDNIERLKAFRLEQSEENKWSPSHSLVVGEFKHRLIALKQRCTLASKISTWYFLNREL